MSDFLFHRHHGVVRRLMCEFMHEVTFPNIYIMPNIIYYIPPLTIVIVLVMMAEDFKGQTNSL